MYSGVRVAKTPDPMHFNHHMGAARVPNSMPTLTKTINNTGNRNIGMDPSRTLMHGRRPLSPRQAPRHMMPKQPLRTATSQPRVAPKNAFMQTFQTEVPPNVRGGQHIEFQLPDGRKASKPETRIILVRRKFYTYKDISELFSPLYCTIKPNICSNSRDL